MFVYNQNASNLMLALQDPITTQQLYQRQMIIFPLYEPGRGVGESNFISYVRLILDVDAKKYGYVEIQENDGEFKKMVDIENAGEVFIMYANQQIVYSANPIDASVREAISRIGTDQTSGMFKDNKGNIYFYAASEYSGLSVYLKYDPTVLYSSLSFLEKATYLVAGIITVASFLLIFLFSHWLVAPLRDLRDSILRVNYKNMGLQIQPTNNNEIKMLKEAFQSILDQLKLSIENEIASNKAETKARMAALQAQIAPHFIHNVLYAISIAAEEHRTHDVRSMCEQLSEMMRYTVKSGTVRLEEEMNYIVNYLSLQAKKYEDFLIFEVKMDEQTKELQFPRLSIQPFVENAIKYAFNDRRPPYRISVISELKEGRWRIDIIDNGTGMDRATIEAVYRKLEKGELIYDHSQSDMRPATDLNGMGIVNSALRLKMFYGESFKFSIDNHREGGTVVSLEGSGRPSA
jgi:two-component system sensor histidine kinase YesM